MNCKICGKEAVAFDAAEILKKYQVAYYRCPACGFIQTEEPFWLDEAYTDAIAQADIGLVGRNVLIAEQVSAILKVCFSGSGSYLDYGGGYGLFVRLMRDRGFDFEWYDKYCENLFSPQFKKSKARYDVITAFELMEHLANPLEIIGNLLGQTEALIFSTMLLPSPPPPVREWWYYAPAYGQHIAFYSNETFKIIANRFDCRYSYYENIHILSAKQIPNWKLRICIRFPHLVHRFIKRQSLLTADFERITNNGR